MSKELKDPARNRDDSFDLDELVAELATKGRDADVRPGKRSRVQSLEDVLALLGDSSLSSADRERIGAAYLAGQDKTGQAIDAGAAQEVGANLGEDLSSVRVHTDSATAQIIRALGVQAFTFGREIFFGTGLYDPQGTRGRSLLTHELAHVAQHRGAKPRFDRSTHVGATGDRFERDADQAASRVLSGKSARVNSAPAAVRFSRDVATSNAYGGEDEPIPHGGFNMRPDELEDLISRLRGESPQYASTLLAQAPIERRAPIRHAIKEVFGADEASLIVQRAEEDAAPMGERPHVLGLESAVQQIFGLRSHADQESMIGEQPGTAAPVAVASAGGEKKASKGPAEHEAERSQDFGVDELSDSERELVHTQLVNAEIWGAAEANGLDSSSEVRDMVGSAVTRSLLGMDVTTIASTGVSAYAKISGRAALGTTVGSGIALYSLFQRDWAETWETLSDFGNGATEYERLANSIAAVSETMEIASSVLKVMAGAATIASGGLWLASVVTVGAASPLAATLTAVSAKLALASLVIGTIGKLVLSPAELVFRQMHEAERNADPYPAEMSVHVLEGYSAQMAELITGQGQGGGSKSERAAAAPESDVSTSSDVDRDPGLPFVAGGAIAAMSAATSLAENPVGAGVRGEGKGGASVGEDGIQTGTHSPTAEASTAKSTAPETDIAQRDESTSDPQIASTTPQVSEDLQAKPAMPSISSPEPGAAAVQASEPVALQSVARVEGGPPVPEELDAVLVELGVVLEQKRTAEAQSQAGGNAELAAALANMQEIAVEQRSMIDSRRDAQATQRSKHDQLDGAINIYQTKRSELATIQGAFDGVSDVANQGGQLPGPLGRGMQQIVSNSQRFSHAVESMNEQMDGQKQEAHSTRADLDAKAQRLDAVQDRTQIAQDRIAAAQSALASSESPGTAGLEARAGELRQRYADLVGELRTWSAGRGTA